ncbi:c6 zinc finger domain-containing protein [Colletotrichum incanum]|uniref:C6 zinc finger domain-containing protein n=1 Tax=Colletotrichum incanum TaxID=1573173 RepID=A0A167CCR0_COLIC|nr:c6 zinc finger domain-containing protein [Colletotrichum incanum]
MSTMTEAVAPPIPASAAKKKFATPPVKIACLACRASRTRCDGSTPCASCKSRGRECVYKPSRRGGARVRRKPRPVEELAQQAQAFNGEMPSDEVAHQDRESLRLRTESDQFLTEATAISVQNYIDPGAGLKQLQDFFQDSDFIFDTLFMSGVPGSTSGESASEHSFNFPAPQIPVARTYKSDQAILDAYYIFIHPFFPILPPPAGLPMDQAVPHFQNDTDGFADEYQPSTPLSLAISAILALIPCANDTNHLNKESVVFRRRYAQYLAQCAVESIEIESEIPDSSIEPPKALNESPDDFTRQQFHPGVPIELESIIALDILSVYEYAQRGNLKKMQARAGQALVSAMSLSLHTCTEDDEFSEAKRRVWWMTYICVCQGSIVSNTEPTFSVFTPSYTAKYPVIQSDPEVGADFRPPSPELTFVQAFAVYIQAQQAILSATQFVIELNKTVKSGGDMTRIYARMKEMEQYLEPLNAMADSWILQSTTTTPLDPTEEILSRSLRCMARIKLNSARIKLHRYCAFFDMPVFSGKHCDLKSKSENDGSGEPRSWPSCSCSSMMSLPSPAVPVLNGSTTPPDKKSPHSEHSANGNSPAAFPFSSHQSAKICLKAAINIAQSFDDLPYPNPFGQLCPPPCYLAPTSTVVCPRTMPSFACCAMQCAYALLMVNHKTKAMYPENALATPMVESLLMRLQTGLASISATLENYATAFEALGGMRDQIRSVIEPTMMFDTPV